MVTITQRFNNIVAAAKGKLQPTTVKRQKLARRVTEQQLSLLRQDIGKFRMAQMMAKDFVNPNRDLLYNLYDDLLLDAHLSSVMQTREINVLGKAFKLVEMNSGKEDKTKTTLLQAPWFRKFLRLALQSKSWGHSLIEFGDLQDGQFTEVLLVPRANVVPELGIVKENVYGGGQQFQFREDPSLWVLEVGEERDLGLLEKAAPHVLWKRAAQAAWSEYCEVFGMPVRIGFTDTSDPNDRSAFEAMLRDMGTSAYMMLGLDEKIEFAQAARTDAYEVYNQRISVANGEISKLFLGQTMTTENGSSRSQAEVHERVAEAYTEEDMQDLVDLVNFKLIPFLIERGYPLQGFMFQWDYSENLDLKSQWGIVNEILQRGYEVPEKYITETFGVPVKKAVLPSPLPIPDPNPKENFKQPRQPQTTAQLAGLTAFYSGIHTCNHVPYTANFELPDGFEKEVDRLMEEIFNSGKAPVLDAALYDKIYQVLSGAVSEGYGAADADQVAFLLENVQVFSAFKTHQQLRAFSDLLVDGEGNVRTFSQFKKEALQVHEQYNVNWLRTEYNQAVGSSQMAAKWNDAPEDAILSYQTVGDGRVRKEHEIYDHITLPKAHPFWNTHYPPNDWNCRCTVSEVANDAKISPEKSLTDLPKLTVFANNVGKTGVIFPEDHPYFDASKEVKAEIKTFLDKQ